MDPKELWKLLRKVPFEPFAFRLHDGRSFEIRHPEIVVPSKRSIYIGLYEATPDGPVDDWVLVSPTAVAPQSIPFGLPEFGPATHDPT